MRIYLEEQRSFCKLYLPKDKVAGLFCFHLYLKEFAETDFSFHLFPRKNFRFFGYQKSWYDGPIYEFGLGPLFLFVIISGKGFKIFGKSF
jgi:hypothetical protein